MSVSTLFRVGGDAYSGLSDVVALIPGRSLRTLATDVLRHLVALDRVGELTEMITDRSIAEALGWSTRSVQRALHALHRVLADQGCAIIDRIRQHGRRVISFVRGLASSGSKPFAPPAPPSNEDKNTTTGNRSSSSPLETPEPPERTDGDAHSELVDRAMKMFRDATRARVRAAIAVYGPEWFAQALDVAEARGKKPGNLAAQKFFFVLRTLANWKDEGGPPARPAPTPTAPPQPRAPEPVQRMTAQEVADLVAACQDSDPRKARWQRSTLRGSVKQGSIPPELLATIPPDLLEEPRGP